MDNLTINGTHVPRLGLGTWQLTGDTCERTVATALDVGYRHIDTARAYHNERDIGVALRHSRVPRDVVWITTKIWPNDLTHDALIRSAQQSLAGLQTEYLDLALIHWPSTEVPLAESLAALDELRRRGRVRHIGVSNFSPSMVEQAVEITEIFCNQVEYHPFLAQPELLRLAREHDLMFTAYSPLAQGRAVRDPVIQQIAQSHNRSPAQVVLRWLVQQENVVAIPRTRDSRHLRENLDVFEFSLDPSEMQQVHDLARGERLVHPATTSS